MVAEPLTSSYTRPMAENHALMPLDSPASADLSLAHLEQQYEMVDRLDAAIRATLPCVDVATDLPPIHHFADGLYARTMVVPAGMLLVGMVHRSQHLSILSAGSISVWSADSNEVQHFDAPHILVAAPGACRIGYTHTDTVWTTIHATDAATVADAEAALLITRPQRAAADPEDVAALQSVLSLLGAAQLEPPPADGSLAIEGAPV